VNGSRDLPRDIGGFIRDLRRNARISLRQLADQAGVSNPYLSQIERGLRKPSAEVLAQLASALRVSTPLMYLRAGLLDSRDGQGVLAAVAADPDLTISQKQSLSQIYETFRRENARAAAEVEGTQVPIDEPAHHHTATPQPGSPITDRTGPVAGAGSADGADRDAETTTRTPARKAKAAAEQSKTAAGPAKTAARQSRTAAGQHAKQSTTGQRTRSGRSGTAAKGGPRPTDTDKERS
jgi:transcriptional regulator with XRE-family HTH domain